MIQVKLIVMKDFVICWNKNKIVMVNELYFSLFYFILLKYEPNRVFSKGGMGKIYGNVTSPAVSHIFEISKKCETADKKWAVVENFNFCKFLKLRKFNILEITKIQHFYNFNYINVGSKWVNILYLLYFPSKIGRLFALHLLFFIILRTPINGL